MIQKVIYVLQRITVMTFQRKTESFMIIALISTIILQPMSFTSAIPFMENNNEKNEHKNIVEKIPPVTTGNIVNNEAIPKIDKNTKGKIPEHYIVVLRDSIDDTKKAAHSLTEGKGMKIGIVYSNALKGFSAVIPENALDRIKNDPRVKYIEEDRVVHAFDRKQFDKHITSTLSHTSVQQTVPTGVDRIDADLTNAGMINGYKAETDIAIIDTGIDQHHPDLNVVRGATCFGAGLPGGFDDNGHGTHVAGTAAALDNDIGVVGVAPGAKLWAVKVLNSLGSGSLSCVISGVDYVTANSDEIEVANMSLGCKCESQALKEAIRKSVEAGVVYAVAAGNSAEDATSFEPANYSMSIDGVLTVSAMADSDGVCGQLGADTNTGKDDTFATFSNFGEPITIAAPGVDIMSTFLFGTYVTLSGTSMATPHTSGAIALLLDNPQNSNMSPKEIRDTIVQRGVSQNKECITSLQNGEGGFMGDSDGVNEPMLYIAHIS